MKSITKDDILKMERDGRISVEIEAGLYGSFIYRLSCVKSNAVYMSISIILCISACAS